MNSAYNKGAAPTLCARQIQLVESKMPIPDNADKEKLAEVALALLWLGAHGDKHVTRVWKGIDWDVTDILYEKGWISDSKSKAKSVLLTEEGEKLAQEYFEKHFSKSE